MMRDVRSVSFLLAIGFVLLSPWCAHAGMACVSLPWEPWWQTLSCTITQEPGVSVLLSGLILVTGLSYAFTTPGVLRILSGTAFAIVVVSAAMFRMMTALGF